MTRWHPDQRFDYDVNLSLVYAGLPILERADAAARDGFTRVESWWPFAEPVPSDTQVDRFLGSLSAAGSRLVSLNLDGGDTAAGDRGFASLPEQQERFRANLASAAAIVEATGCGVVNVLYGNRQPGVDPALQDALALESLALAAQTLAAVGARIVVETLNAIDTAAYPLTDPAATVAVLDQIVTTDGVPAPALLFDVYHLARMGHDIVATIETFARRIGHVQLADHPGRGRPGTGQIDFPSVMDALWDNGYRAGVGLEYVPGDRPSDRPA